MGRLELQFNGIPLLLGYIPVNREPRWGLLNGQLLMADVNTTDSRAKSFKRGVCTGVIPKVHFLAKTFLAPELHRLITVLVGKNVMTFGWTDCSACGLYSPARRTNLNHLTKYLIEFSFLPSLFYASILPGSNSRHNSAVHQSPHREEYCPQSASGMKLPLVPTLAR